MSNQFYITHGFAKDVYDVGENVSKAETGS